MSFILLCHSTALELRYDGAGLVWTVEIEWMIHSKKRTVEIQR
ncbi:hypothetical protein VCR12J2_620022 [Vibrio coralliirubri]|nr:hypothetical protein VCR12J2_620022 [Vibrio coralliirubri]